MFANKSRSTLLLVIVASVVFRLLLIPVARHGDINNNVSWGSELLVRGPLNFYEGKQWPFSAPNQPPLYLYLFGLVSLLHGTITALIAFLNAHLPVFPSPLVWWWDFWGELYTAKLPGIIADIGIAFVIFKALGKRKQLGLGLAALWLINPVSWYNSAIWGGTDSIVNLLGLVSIVFLLKKKLQYAVVFLVLSILFKSSLLLLSPLFLFVVLHQKYQTQKILEAALIAFVFAVAVSFPFHLSIDSPLWLFNLYTQRFLPGEVGSLTANAFNFWWLVNPGAILDTQIYMGLSARMWGIVATLVGYGVTLVIARTKGMSHKLFLAFAIVSLITFLFMTRIHERYMYPFFPLATIALASFRWLWIPYVLLSVSHLLNLYHLFWAPGIPAIEALYANPLLAITLSAVNIICALYIIVRFYKSL